jgi:hypothetical protein
LLSILQDMCQTENLVSVIEMGLRQHVSAHHNFHSIKKLIVIGVI